MLSSSTEYRNMVATQTELRKWEFRVLYTQTPLFSKELCLATSNEIKTESQVSYTIDNDILPSYNYATFEQDRWKLDGSFALVGDETVLEDIPTINNTLSDATTRIFSIPFVCTFTFSQVFSSSGFSIYFDVLNNEYAEEFTISYYDSLDVLITTIAVVGNANVLYIDEQLVNDWQKIILTVTKWNVANRLAKITEVYFGVLREYTTSNGLLINAKVQESMDVLNLEVRGNDSNFTIDNRDNSFNPLLTGTLYDYATEGQSIDLTIGLYLNDVAIDWKTLGKYSLRDIKANNENKTATFNCDGLLLRMSKTDYKKSIYANQSLYDLALEVLTDFGLSPTQYSIDSSLSLVSTNSFLPIMSYKECLQAIAIAGNLSLYEDREGKIILRAITRTPLSYTITKTNMFKVPSIEQKQGIYKLNIDKYTYTEDTLQEISNQTVVAGTYDITVEYDPSVDIIATLTDGTVNTSTYYTSYCILNITANTNTNLIINAKPLVEVKTTNKLTTQDSKGKTVTISNSLITTDAHILSTQTWIQSEYTYLNELKEEWRGDPIIEISDIIDSETQFTNQTNAVVTENSIEYAGYLKAKTTLIGGNV